MKPTGLSITNFRASSFVGVTPQIKVYRHNLIFTIIGCNLPVEAQPADYDPRLPGKKLANFVKLTSNVSLIHQAEYVNPLTKIHHNHCC
ncbi:MAG: hypothetical protein DUD32_11075 [Lactobacillus sp.]|nr:MAG: hypothetical protein DUD32_11075 [Lactobacillus sp.]